MKLIINPHNFSFLYQVNVTGSCGRPLLPVTNGSPYKYSTFKSPEGVGSSDEAAVCVYDY